MQFNHYSRALLFFLFTAVLSGLSGTAGAQYLSTVAGKPGQSSSTGDGGLSTSATFSSPYDVAVDAAGNFYIADYFGCVIRKVDGSTGIISTFAGNGSYGYSGDGGPATSASLGGPSGVTTDAAGNVYITDQGNSVIWKVNTAGIITRVAGDPNAAYTYSGDGGPATSAGFNYPYNTAVDAAGDIYISDAINQVVRKVDGTTGFISTVAGGGSNASPTYSGPATGALLNYTMYVAVDGAGNLYVSEGSSGYGGQTIRKVTPSGSMTTVAGNGSGNASAYNYSGPALNAGINAPGIVVDASGNLYMTDETTNTVRKVDAAGNMTNYAGSGIGGYGGDNGPATGSNAAFYFPEGISVDAAGNLYVVDVYNYIVRKVGSLPAAPTITFADVTKYLGEPDFTLTASSNSGSPFTYTLADPTIAKITGNTVHLLQAGTTTLTVSQAGSFLWQSASLTVNFTVMTPNQTIAFSDITVQENAPDFALTATASSGLPVSYSIADPTIAAITNGVVHLLKAGITTITATQAGDGSTWSLAPPVTVNLIVTQAIGFADVTTIYGGPDFALTATEASGQPVVFSIADPTIATITGGTLHILKAGVTTLAVSQVGDNDPPAQATLTVNKAMLTITADNQTKQQGQDNPPLTVSYSGFVNAETNSYLSAQPTVVTTAVTPSPEGAYPIAASGAASDNYAFTYQPGVLTVGPPAGAAVTANGLNAFFSGNVLQVQVSSLVSTPALWQLVDMTGRVLVSQNVTLSGGMVSTFQLPVPGLAHGAYIVSVRGGGLKLSDKIIY